MDNRVLSHIQKEDITELPEPIIATITDLIDAYLKGGLASKWLSYGYLAKSYANSITTSIYLPKLFNDFPEQRKQFCEQLIIAIREKTFDKLCKVVIDLGNKAHEEYKNANYYSLNTSSTYPHFFLVAHMVRNIIVDHLKKNYRNAYDGYTKDKLMQLDDTSLKEKQALKKGDCPINLRNQILLLENELSYLEHEDTITKTAIKFKDLEQPTHLPSLSTDNQNIAFFLQPNFGERFFQKAYADAERSKFSRETLESYIAMKRKNIALSQPQPH
jgi:hypothetical protein